MAGKLNLALERGSGLAMLGALLLAIAAPAAAQQVCQLCPAETTSLHKEPAEPLTVEIESMLDFDRVALSGPGGGSVAVDPLTGRRSVSGEVIELGGMAIQGTATVRGEPGRAIRVQLPHSVTLHSSEGGSAELTELEADLPNGARLGRDGTLRFSFGGRLAVKGDAGGDYRGRVLLVVDYQ